MGRRKRRLRADRPTEHATDLRETFRPELISGELRGKDTARFVKKAAVLLGRTSNGRVEWRDADGRSLKQTQEAASASHPTS